jgi:hypothetical protein
VLDTTVDGVRALLSNDLLVRHPTNHNLWKVFGRQGDVLQLLGIPTIDIFN